MRSGMGRPKISRQPGRASITVPFSNESRIFMVWGRVERDDLRAAFGGHVRCVQLSFAGCRVEGGHPEHVPVGRPVRQQGEGRHEVHLLLREPVDAAGEDEFEGGPLVWCERRGERFELCTARRPRGHRFAVAVVVGVGLRGREPEGTLLVGALGEGGHRRDLVVAGDLAHRGVAHHRTAQCGVADEEARIGRDGAVETTEPFAEGGPRPVEELQCGQGHSFHPSHHPGEVVGVLGAGRGEREAAVAPDDGRHPVEGGGARGRVPGELRVVVGVQVDETGGHQETVGVDDGCCRFVDLADRHDRAVAHADVRAAGGASGPVHHRPTTDDQVEHRATSLAAHPPWLPIDGC